MWDTSTITLQTKTDVNVRGSIKSTWTDSEIVSCDVQNYDARAMSKEFMFNEFGTTDSGELRAVYDSSLNPNWVKGNQCKYEGEQWWIKFVDKNLGEIGLSNHIYVVLLRVI